MYQVVLGYTGKCLDVLGYARMCKDVLGYARLYQDVLEYMSSSTLTMSKTMSMTMWSDIPG